MTVLRGPGPVPNPGQGLSTGLPEVRRNGDRRALPPDSGRIDAGRRPFYVRRANGPWEGIQRFPQRARRFSAYGSEGMKVNERQAIGKLGLEVTRMGFGGAPVRQPLRGDPRGGRGRLPRRGVRRRHPLLRHRPPLRLRAQREPLRHPPRPPPGRDRPLDQGRLLPGTAGKRRSGGRLLRRPPAAEIGLRLLRRRREALPRTRASSASAPIASTSSTSTTRTKASACSLVSIRTASAISGRRWRRPTRCSTSCARRG